MKRLALAISILAVSAVGASAADMAPAPVYTKAPPPVVAIYNWTGFYIGLNGGGGWADDRSNVVYESLAGVPYPSTALPGGAGTFGSRSAAGGFGGGQIGYNWQAQNWVFGLEADAQGSGIRGSEGATLPYFAGSPGSTITATTTERLDWFGTVRGRLGYAWNNFLLYGTGGFAFGQTNSTITTADSFGFTSFGADTTTRTGYVVGAGAEYGFAPNWSAKLEYQYLDLGRGTINAVEFLAGAPTIFATANSTRYDYHTVRLGINYRWGGPVVARY
jgi:outer membrane immunogenic protein